MPSTQAIVHCADYRFKNGIHEVLVGGSWLDSNGLSSLVSIDEKAVPEFTITDRRSRDSAIEVLVGGAWHKWTDIESIIDFFATGGGGGGVSISQVNSAVSDAVDPINASLTSDESLLDTRQEIVDFIQQNRIDIGAKQDLLVSGTNLKTVGGTSLLGPGDIPVSGGGLSFRSTTHDTSASNVVVEFDGVVNEIRSYRSTGTNALRINAGNGIAFAGGGTFIETGDSATAVSLILVGNVIEPFV